MANKKIKHVITKKCIRKNRKNRKKKDTQERRKEPWKFVEGKS